MRKLTGVTLPFSSQPRDGIMRDCIKERKFIFFTCVYAFLFLFVSSPVSANSNQTSTASEAEIAFPAEQPDPFQRVNRAVFAFNDKVDIFILKPIASLYNKIIPKPLNQGIHNVYNNINMVPTIANDILQLHFYQMLRDMWRLGINTTLGVGGLFDIAGRIGLEQYNNDFGLTLARYGWKDSTFLVLPFFGPSTIRDGIEIPVDYYAFSIYPYIHPPLRRYQVWGLGIVDRRAQLLQFESVMEEAALDRYLFVRNAFLQRRAYQIEQNNDCRLKRTQGPSSMTLPSQEEVKPVSQAVGEPPRDQFCIVVYTSALKWKSSSQTMFGSRKAQHRLSGMSETAAAKLKLPNAPEETIPMASKPKKKVATKSALIGKPHIHSMSGYLRD